MTHGDSHDSRTSYLNRPGGRIAYAVHGIGPLVVCVPGMGDVRSVYRFLAEALVGAGFRVVTMDLRGHGKSDASFETYDDIAAGTDVVALVEHLGGPAILVGNSMGAGAVCWAAGERRDLAAGLVLIGPFVRDPSTSGFGALLFRLALRRPWGRAAWGAYFKTLYPARRGAEFDTHFAEVAANLRTPGHWDAFVATTRTTHAPAEAHLGAVRALALVVMGEADPDFPEPAAEAHWIAEQLDAQVLMVPGAGHYPQAEFPEIVSPAVAEFALRVESLRDLTHVVEAVAEHEDAGTRDA